MIDGLYDQRFIDNYFRKYRENCTHPRSIGLELEFPLVAKNGKAIGRDILVNLFEALGDTGFDIEYDVNSGFPIGATRLLHDNDKFPLTVSPELGFCTLELALPPFDNLFQVRSVLTEQLEHLTEWFNRSEVSMLAYGIQPISEPSKNLMTPKRRFKAYANIPSNNFIDAVHGNDEHAFTITAASQAHIDVSEDEAVMALNCLNSLAGVFIALCANSPLWRNMRFHGCMASRELFYDYAYAARRNRFGIPNRPFASLEDYFRFLCSLQLEIVERAPEFLLLTDSVSFHDFIHSDKEFRCASASGLSRHAHSKIEDLEILDGLVWYNNRLSPKYGTIEARNFCQQPRDALLAPAAMTLGLVENLEAVAEFVGLFPIQQWIDLRVSAARNGLSARIHDRDVLPIVRDALNLAYDGLILRGFGEELFLDPLFERVAERKSPAERILGSSSSRDIERFIEMVRV